MPVTPEGTWTIADAQTLRGNPYTGTVNVHRNGDVYQVFWLTNSNNYSGLGFCQDNCLFVGWSFDLSFRVVLYRIKPDGSLEGQWTSPQFLGETGTESASGTQTGEIEGIYRISGSYPTPQPDYTNTIAIGQVGEIYQLSSSGTPQLQGIGLRSGDWLITNWGYGRNFGVMAYKLDRDSATGRWTRPGTDKVGTETLAKIC